MSFYFVVDVKEQQRKKVNSNDLKRRLFMEENKETVEDAKVEETGDAVTQTDTKTEEAVKTFTQEEVNTMLKKEKQKAEKKYEGIDIAKYKAWEESQKTAEQKQAEKEAEHQKTLIELNTLKQTNIILAEGVKNDDVDYVLFKVSKMEGEFEENLAKFLKDNPKFLGQELEEHKATGAPVKTLGSNQNDGVLSILANKHKDIKF